MYPVPMQGRRRAAVFLAPLAAGLGAVILCLASPADRAGLRIYDLLLGLRGYRESPREILLIQMDEATGPREWDGEDIADGLVAMAEMGARYAVFPLPGTLDTSVRAKDGSPAPDMAAAIDEEFALIDENVEALFDAIRLGSIPPKESPRFVAELLGTIDAGKTRLQDEAAGAGRGDRARLEGALRLFGRAYLAVDPLSTLPSRRNLPVDGARGRGSSRLLADSDGAIRRVALVSDRKGGRLDHVTFVALLDRLGGPTLALSAKTVTIRGGTFSDRERDLVVPLSRGGLLVDWPRPGRASPRRLPWSELARAALLERELMSALAGMEDEGLLAPGGGALPGLHDYATALGEESLRKGVVSVEWQEARERFFDLTARYLAGTAEAELVAAVEYPPPENPPASGGRSEEEASALRSRASERRDAIRAAFAGARETSAELARARARLRTALEGSFCIVAPSFADANARPTPFGDDPTEGLASAALVDSILSERFLRELPAPLGLAIGALLGLAVALVCLELGSKWAAAAGAGLALAGAAGCVALFLATGAYLSPLAPALGPLGAGAAAYLVADNP